MNGPAMDRRHLLPLGGAFGALGVGAPFALQLAAAGSAAGQSAGDYKALVCIYLHGGNDGENTLVRFDSPGYQAYSAIRTPASGINVAQAQLLPVQPARGGPPFGFHPACAGLQGLFDRRELAVVANVGMLVRPVTKAALETQGAPRPANLFSHNDQELAQQSADASGLTRNQSIDWTYFVEQVNRFGSAYSVGLALAVLDQVGTADIPAGVGAAVRDVPSTLADRILVTMWRDRRYPSAARRTPKRFPQVPNWADSLRPALA